jgi:hypothetical protein
MVELRYQRGTFWRQRGVALIPAAVRFGLRIFTKKEVVPDNVADTAILETAALVLRKMPREEQVRMMGAFPSDLMLIVGARLMEIAERQEKEEANAAILASAKATESAAPLDGGGADVH